MIRDAFWRSGRPINTVRQLEKGLRIPRTPKTPAKTPAAPKTYTSGDRIYKMPACSLENAHSSPVGPGRISVKAAFSGATLFITGASGYVGSVVLEQLLRVCPEVARIYLLIRGKRGSTGTSSPLRLGCACMRAPVSCSHRGLQPPPPQGAWLTPAHAAAVAWQLAAAWSSAEHLLLDMQVRSGWTACYGGRSSTCTGMLASSLARWGVTYMGMTCSVVP